MCNLSIHSSHDLRYYIIRLEVDLMSLLSGPNACLINIGELFLLPIYHFQLVNKHSRSAPYTTFWSVLRETQETRLLSELSIDILISHASLRDLLFRRQIGDDIQRNKFFCEVINLKLESSRANDIRFQLTPNIFYNIWHVPAL